MAVGQFDVVMRKRGTPAKNKKEIAGLVYLMKAWLDGNFDKTDAVRIVITEHDVKEEA